MKACIYNIWDFVIIRLIVCLFYCLLSENVRSGYQEMVEHLQKTWQLVGDKFRDHSGSSRQTFLNLNNRILTY